MDTLLIAALVIVVAVLAPFGTIWMLNTLFSLGLLYTFKTWLAALLLNSLFMVPSRKNN